MQKVLTFYALESGLYATAYFNCLLCNKNKYIHHTLSTYFKCFVLLTCKTLITIKAEIFKAIFIKVIISLYGFQKQ